MVSIIMSNFNTDVGQLKESIDSILNQSYKDIEIIVIDDCSNNYSVDYLEKLNNKFDNIKLVKNCKNMGLAYSMNKAIKISSGKYIARMDTDDICVVDRILKQVEYMEKNDDVDVLGTSAYIFGEKSGLSFSPFHGVEDIKCQLLYSTVLIHPTIMFRASKIKIIDKLYDESYKCSQDFELWTRLVKSMKIAVLNKPLLKYRIHSKQISSEKKELQKKYAIQICEREIKNMKIDSYYEFTEAHMVICQKEELTYNNLSMVDRWINILIDSNKKSCIYNNRVFKKNLYNRYFNIVVNSNLNFKSKIRILICKRLINFSNLYALIYRSVYCLYWERINRM